MKIQNCIGTIERDFKLQGAVKLDAIQAMRAGLGLFGNLFAMLCVWQQRVELRARMANLDARTLDDIGLSREQVVAEAKKPFWKA